MTLAEVGPRVWAGYVASEQIRLLIAPILERTKGEVGTHSPSCYEYHVACLAARINELIGEKS